MRALPFAILAGSVAPLFAQSPKLYYDFNAGTALNTGTLGGTGTVQSGVFSGVSPAPGSQGTYYSNSVDGNASGGIGINTGITAANAGFTGAYTAMAWVRLSTTVGDNMVFGQNADVGGVLHDGVRDGAWHQGHWGNDTTTGAVPTGVWTHVTYRFDGANQQIFVNGNSIIGPQAKGALANATTNIFLGASENNGGFLGDIDSVAVFASALTPIQIFAVGTGLVAPTNSAGLAAAVQANPANVGILAPYTVKTVLAASQTMTNLAAADAALAGGGVVTTSGIAEINFKQSGGGGGDGNFLPNAEFPGISAAGDIDDFAMQATTTIRAAIDGYYQFGINGDDGGRLRIDGNIVINDDTLHGPQDATGFVFLSAGNHSLQHTFFERGGGAESELFMLDAAGNRTLLNNVVVPEPSLAGLLGITLVLGFRRRRV